MIKDKILLGQYYTTKNPFKGSAFDIWNNRRPKNSKILEPFAGAGNLFSMVDGDWVGYDIQPNNSSIIRQDTIKDFPKGYEVCITNPPYLAKNSLSRKKGELFFKYEDLYLDCLELALQNCEYIAAIIPSTFYGTKMFRERLMCWDKIDCELFDDTNHPVGVAYFGPGKYETQIFVNGESVETIKFPQEFVRIRFNVEDGNYVLSAIDKNSGDNIHIEPVNESFNREKYLKNTSRNYVLFHYNGILDTQKVNEEITNWRNKTKDFELTSFKSTMKSGKYRKRMSFITIKQIITKVVNG